MTRTSYVQINTANGILTWSSNITKYVLIWKPTGKPKTYCCVCTGKKYNFEKKDSNNLVGPYDYYSVMHYPATMFSTNGNPTIVAISPNVVRNSYKSPKDSDHLH